jgi:hypothetical protein
MSNNRLKYLLDHFISHRISPEEEQELLQIIASGNYDDEVKEYMADAWHTEYSELMSKQQSNRILNAVFSHESARVIPFRNKAGRRWVWVAASLLLVVASTGLFLL